MGIGIELSSYRYLKVVNGDQLFRTREIRVIGLSWERVAKDIELSRKRVARGIELSI